MYTTMKISYKELDKVTYCETCKETDLAMLCRCCKFEIGITDEIICYGFNNHIHKSCDKIFTQINTLLFKARKAQETIRFKTMVNK